MKGEAHKHFRSASRASPFIRNGNNFIKILQQQSTVSSTPLLHRYRLRQIPWLVHIAPSGNRCVIGKQLQRNTGKQRAEDLQGRGNVEDIVGVLLDGLVPFGGNDDDVRVAGANLLDVADNLLVDMGGCGYPYEGRIRVEQGNGAVLEFPSGKALGVDVGDFFEFEGPPQRGRITYSTSDEDHT